MADQSLNQPLNAPRQPGGMGSDAPASEGGDRQLGERYGRALASLGNPTLQQHLAVLRDVLGSDRALWPALRHLIEQPGFEAVRNDPSAAMRQGCRDAWLQDLATWCNQASLARVEAFLDGLLQLPNSAASAAVAEDQDPAPSHPFPSQRHEGNLQDDPAVEGPSLPATQPASSSHYSNTVGPEATVRRLREQGQEASRRGEHQRAIDLFREALRWDSGNVAIYMQRASVQAMAGNFGAAIEDFNAILKLQPGHLEALAQRGKARATLGRLEEAKQDWLEASQQGHPEARTWLAQQRQFERRHFRDQGMAARDSGDSQQAIALFTAALEIDGSDAKLYLWRAELLAREGNLRMALEDLFAALRLEPDNAELLAMKGDLYFSMGRSDLARQNWRAAIDHGHRGAKERLAQDYIDRALKEEAGKNYRESIDLITEAIHHEAAMPEAYMIRGKSYQCLQEHQKAWHDFSRVLAMEASNTEALVQRGHVLTALNRRQEAEADWKKARELRESEAPRKRDKKAKTGFYLVRLGCAVNALSIAGILFRWPGGYALYLSVVSIVLLFSGIAYMSVGIRAPRKIPFPRGGAT